MQRGRHAPTTQNSYAFAWKSFEAWCAAMERISLPAEPETLKLYIAYLLTKGRVVTTAAAYAAGIAHHHRTRSLASPLTDEIREILWGLSRDREDPPRQMLPMTIEEFRRIAGAYGSEDTAIAARNRALVVICMSTAFRRSNLAWLKLEHITFVPEGLLIHVRREKQDRKGAGRMVGLPTGQHESTCPVRCLEAWLVHRGRHEGHLFTRLDPGRGDPPGGLSGNAIWTIMKGSFAKIGVPLDRRGTHSGRVGFVSAAGAAGISPLIISSHTGQSLETVRRYFRPAEVFRSNALGDLGL